MAKKKKKKKKKYLTNLQVIDMQLDNYHELAADDIRKMTRYLEKKDKKIKNKSKKYAKNGLLSTYNPVVEQEKARIRVVEALKKTKILDLAQNLLQGVMPIVITVARLLAALITLIFNCKPIRDVLSPRTVFNLEGVYQVAMAIH